MLCTEKKRRLAHSAPTLHKTVYLTPAAITQCQLGGKSPGKTSQESTINSAVIGTAVGAAAGAALGGSEGAAVGAGTGLLFGSVAGADSGRYQRGTSQTMYDHAYIQCMYGAGHRVPVPAGMFSTEQRAAPKAPPPGASVPPPPPAPPPPATPR